MQDISPLHVTMEQLDKMLTALGYVRQDVEGATVFRDDAHDALIVLPVLAADAVVSQAHLIAVRNNVVGKGIASSARFSALLHRPPLAMGKASKTSSL